MDGSHLRGLLEKVQNGSLNLDHAMKLLRKLPFDDIGYAKVDHHRCIRQGVPEVIYCQGKTVRQIQGMAGEPLV